MTIPSPRTILRARLAGNDFLAAPGVYDGITARMAAQGGFEAIYMTGAGVSASRGFPDFGLLTLTEMAQAAGVIAQSVPVPVIADADTGYGNELNVTRTIREYERAGIAGLHIEDQVAPKRCGHLDGKEIVPRDEFVAKIRAAVAARTDPGFVIIARTDARAVVSLDEAIARANAALRAGADMAFVEAAQSMEELAEIPRRVEGPCLLNIVRGGKTPDLSLDVAQELGYKLAILPSLLIGAVVDACDQTLRALRETRKPPVSANAMPVAERFRRFGADEWNALRTRFRDDTEQAGL
ncbi:isocitrate lyase/PEP mutase family protein [Cupriavidus alkaliphilus]|uniref:2-methylisocitrate lyase-like PEP mutase family enzyme n=1 Tax=Cupriavidus alkaliphilus TaxID=942866 RepID=A0A7W4YU33_9BURK|nr:isocitrate lyase/PEP mutase family protein [Cupriavidus alkaliphilus]MBB3010077.1 2-methylisocitrate lyase-like PEP mutase family enzyme [Cupriavidus alkaliphilus]